MVLQRSGSARGRLEVILSFVSDWKQKARGPGEDRGLLCVTPLRGDRWEGATLGLE